MVLPLPFQRVYSKCLCIAIFNTLISVQILSRFLLEIVKSTLQNGVFLIFFQ